MSEATPHDENGFSLIELIVVVVLLGIMGIVIVTIFVNSWRAQNAVSTTTQATNEGQLVGQSIERAVRNGVALQVTDGGSKLWVRTAYTDSKQCQVFWISSDAKLYMASAGTGAALPSPSAWATGVTVLAGLPAFFTLSNGDTVGYGFNLATAAAPVTISGSVSLRTSPGGGGACWS